MLTKFVKVTLFSRCSSLLDQKLSKVCWTTTENYSTIDWSLFSIFLLNSSIFRHYIRKKRNNFEIIVQVSKTGSKIKFISQKNNPKMSELKKIIKRIDVFSLHLCICQAISRHTPGKKIKHNLTFLVKVNQSCSSCIITLQQCYLEAVGPQPRLNMY